MKKSNKNKGVSASAAEITYKIKAELENSQGENKPFWEISRNIGVSKWHMSRVFKRSTGMTPMEYKKGLRIHMAKELLVFTDASVADVAVACGFSSTTYFSSCFKKEAGISPTKYREKYMTSENSRRT